MYLQNKHRLTGVENELLVTEDQSRGRGRDKLGVWDQQIHATAYEINKGLLYSAGS